MRVSDPAPLRWSLLAALALVLAAPAAARGAAPAHPPGAAAAYTPKGVLPFIEDDYTRAVAEARARKVPLFVESWAPW
ncbi:MAG TPA: hypothetical protein VLV15_05725 [Dongiaceae bacterium]|nr:hypothetical protein [Dongiaceae bacterium]